MGRHETAESGIQRKRSQNVPYGTRYGTHYSISRPSSSRISSSLWQLISPAALANRFAQLSRSIVRYPSRWLGATWLVLVGVGGIAGVMMLKIDPIESEVSIAPSSTLPTSFLQNAATPSPEPPQTERQSEPVTSLTPDRSHLTPGKSKESLPLFALGTVALSCAIGCLLLSYRFSSRSPKTQARLPLRPTRLPRPSAAAQRQRAVSVVEATPSEARSTHVDASAVTVAVISSHESHPLDWNEPSLADHLDIRQQRPLSRWL